MALNSIEKNKKLKASSAGKQMAAVVALKKLRPTGREEIIISTSDGPLLPTGKIAKHLQGMAVRNGKTGRQRSAYLSTSAKDGKIISANSIGNGPNFTVKNEPVGYGDFKNVHPGGIQIIGHYLVIPVYYTNYRGIEIRDVNQGLSIVKKFKTERKPYCVGITTARDKNGEFYVLAAVTENKGNRVDIYRTPSDIGLSNTSCFFELQWTYDARKNPKWNGYANNISLLSDTNDSLYFLGFYNTSKIGLGRNFVDLYHLEIELEPDNPERIKFHRLHTFEAKTNRKRGFRWGAGTNVIKEDAIEIYTCAHNPIDNKKQIETLFYSAKK